MEFCKIWSISTSKFWKKSCHVGAPILGQIFQNFDLANFVISPSYDKPPWRNFDFLVKIEIWNP